MRASSIIRQYAPQQIADAMPLAYSEDTIRQLLALSSNKPLTLQLSRWERAWTPGGIVQGPGPLTVSAGGFLVGEVPPEEE